MSLYQDLQQFHAEYAKAQDTEAKGYSSTCEVFLSTLQREFAQFLGAGTEQRVETRQGASHAVVHAELCVFLTAQHDKCAALGFSLPKVEGKILVRIDGHQDAIPRMTVILYLDDSEGERRKQVHQALYQALKDNLKKQFALPNRTGNE
jgi:hypothetical protein